MCQYITSMVEGFEGSGSGYSILGNFFIEIILRKLFYCSKTFSHSNNGAIVFCYIQTLKFLYQNFASTFLSFSLKLLKKENKENKWIIERYTFPLDSNDQRIKPKPQIKDMAHCSKTFVTFRDVNIICICEFILFGK